MASCGTSQPILNGKANTAFRNRFGDDGVGPTFIKLAQRKEEAHCSLGQFPGAGTEYFHLVPGVQVNIPVLWLSPVTEHCIASAGYRLEISRLGKQLQ